MTRDELANKLNGIEYQEYGLLKDLAPIAKESGLVVLIGCSDDYAELYGAFRDEAHSLFDGGEIRLDKSGIYQPTCEHDECPHERNLKNDCTLIKAIWCPRDSENNIIASWAYETDIPHSIFDVKEGDSIYCKAIVFNVDDIA